MSILYIEKQVPLNDFWVPQPAPVSVQPVREPVVPQTPAEHVKSTVCGLVIRPIQVITFCLAFFGLGFPQSAVSALLTKMDLICKKNGNGMVDIRGMKDSLDQFVESLVQMKEIVDFVVAVIDSLRKKPKVWAFLLDPSSSNKIETALSREMLKSVKRFLTTMGFSEGNNDIMIVHPTLALLSQSQLLESIWDHVSKYNWKSAPQKAVPQKSAPQKSAPQKSAPQKSAPQKPAKRGRNDGEDELTSVELSHVVKKQFTDGQLMKTLITRLMSALLETHGVRELYLNEFFSTAFLDLPPVHLRQMMKFLSNLDNVWVFHRILMEVPQLGFIKRNGDVYLWIVEIDLFSFFNMAEMIRQYHLFSMEAIVHSQNASQLLYEERVRKEQERKHNQRLNEFLRFRLGNLLRTNDMSAFFDGLRQVYHEFDSNHTNLKLLNFVVYEFLTYIYDANTHQYYHKNEPCLDIRAVFMEYAIIRGVFSPKPPIHENIRVCQYKTENCLFGHKCSGAHQEFVSPKWNRSHLWGECCPEYSETRRCTNKHCSNAHITGIEFYRAFQNGGKDSNKMRRKLLAQTK